MNKTRSSRVTKQIKGAGEEDRSNLTEEFHDLYANVPCGYHSLDADGRIIGINDIELSWLGCTRDEIINKPYTSLMTEPGRVRFAEVFDRLKKEGTVCDGEYEITRKDGTTFPVLVTASAVTDAGGKFVMSRSLVLDMTARRAREELLRENEELYRTALESTSDGVTILQDGIYVYVNQKFLDTMGVTGEAIINKPLGVLAGPEPRPGFKTFLNSHPRETPLPEAHVTRVPKGDDTYIYLQSSSVDIIYRGKPSILTFIKDITEQKKAEQALRQSEGLYRTALENTSDGIIIVQEGKNVYVNRKLLKTIGRKEAEMINMPLGTYFHPDDFEKAQSYFTTRIQSGKGPESYDIRIMNAEGSYVTLNIRPIRINYKEKPATLAFVLDVTRRRQTEEALRQSEERYRTIFESVDDDYFETDLKGVFTFLNKPLSWAGLRREELIGTKFSRHVTSEMDRRMRSAFNKIYREGKSTHISDCEIIRKDGGIGHMEMSVSLMRDARGNPIGFRGISRNVSERFRMEEERRKLTDQLHQAQKMEAIGTLAGGIAHDFNNLLMGIQGYTSLMLLDVEATHPHFEQLRAVQNLVQSGTALTRQLLEFARAGRHEVMPTDLNDLIGKSINLFSRTKREISIFEKYTEQLWTVEADRGQIEQVMLNMFVNAWQAMPGGGSLYLETANVVVDNLPAPNHDLQPGRYVKISITDTGIGMDEKTRQRIFDPFFTTKEMGRGTGLGLASAYGIIKGHSGLITVYSEKGQGTTFNIYLPASTKEVACEETLEPELLRGQETILLVDDEDVITEVTGKLLAELGYRIITARSGAEAVDIYTQKHTGVDLVIMDMIMPGLSGSDTFDMLRTINPSLRMILSSGYSMNGKVKEIMDKGVRGFLQKPYRLHELAKKIREALAD